MEGLIRSSRFNKDKGRRQKKWEGVGGANPLMVVWVNKMKAIGHILTSVEYCVYYKAPSGRSSKRATKDRRIHREREIEEKRIA